MKHLYTEKPQAYYQSARKEILPLLPPGRMKILDLGCGEGATLAWLKGIDRCAEGVGIELSESAALQAREIVDRVIVADIERDELAFPADYFDCLLCLDVLEHLQDPWRVLRKLIGWLKANGTVVASIPNVRYKSVVLDLVLRGRFDYQDAGVLDRTHLRFFTRASSISLLESAGLTVCKVMPHPENVSGISGILNALSCGYFRDMLAWQYLIAGVKRIQQQPEETTPWRWNDATPGKFGD